MKKYLINVLFLASAILIMSLLISNIDDTAVSSLRVELDRYGDVNPWYFGLASFFIMISYLSSWISMKISRFDRAI
jgi:hypothetical protein